MALECGYFCFYLDILLIFFGYLIVRTITVLVKYFLIYKSKSIPFLIKDNSLDFARATVITTLIVMICKDVGALTLGFLVLFLSEIAPFTPILIILLLLSVIGLGLVPYNLSLIRVKYLETKKHTKEANYLSKVNITNYTMKLISGLLLTVVILAGLFGSFDQISSNAVIRLFVYIPSFTFKPVNVFNYWLILMIVFSFYILTSLRSIIDNFRLNKSLSS